MFFVFLYFSLIMLNLKKCVVLENFQLLPAGGSSEFNSRAVKIHFFSSYFMIFVSLLYKNHKSKNNKYI